MLQLLEAEAGLSLAQTQHALQLQQARAQMNNMVPKKQFEQLQTSLREEQCKAQQLQENLHWQAEQTCRQMARTQVSRELGNSVKGTGEGALPGWKAVVVEVTRGLGGRCYISRTHVENALDLQIQMQFSFLMKPVTALHSNRSPPHSNPPTPDQIPCA